MATSNPSSKLNRFLFFPEPTSSSSPPSPSPFAFPFSQWASAAGTTFRSSVFFSFLETPEEVVPVLGASKAGTIAGLILITAVFLLSLFFFPGLTLIFLRWLAVSCFYVCLFVFGLIWLICHGLFIALKATFRCLFSEDSIPSRLCSEIRDYRTFTSQNLDRSYILPENRYQRVPGVRQHFVPPVNRAESTAGVRQNPPMQTDNRSNVFTHREKMKETYEYRRAMEAEWASRQQELRRQAEEAQRQRNQRAENKRKKANEKRQQKHHTDQTNSETSRRRKGEETSNQEEKIREDIRRKLIALEKCQDMASLLRSLGIHLPPNPSRNQIRSAYREACKKFHPDRLSMADLRHRIEGEEKFKLISEMKHKISS